MSSCAKESFRDRLLLDNTRIDNMISNVQDIIKLPNPIGQMLDIGVRPNGLEIKKRIYKLPNEVSSINGRGLFIINECFDDIRWSNKGNRLQLALKR